MGVPLEPMAEERFLKTENEKAKLLKTPDGSLPDPLLLKDGWLGERDSITSWPPIFLSDITMFLMSQPRKLWFSQQEFGPWIGKLRN